MYVNNKLLGSQLTQEDIIFTIICYLKKDIMEDYSEIEFRSYREEAYRQYVLVLDKENKDFPYLVIDQKNVVDLSFFKVYATYVPERIN